MYLPLKLNIILFIAFTLIYGENVDIKICADLECKGPISYAKTLLKYVSNDRNIMSFGLNEEVTVYSKYIGSKSNLWTIQIDHKKGDVPKRFVQEYKILAKTLVEIPLETENETVNLKSTAVTEDNLNTAKTLASKTEIGDASTKDDKTNGEVNSAKLVQSTISTENVQVELSPSPVIGHSVTVELGRSESLDNIVEYTEKYDQYSAITVQTGAWFPDVTSSKINQESSQKLMLSSNLEVLSPSLTSAENLSPSTINVKYVIVDGTSIVDEDSAPVLSSSDLSDEQSIQPTQIVSTSSLKHAYSSSVEYFQSSSSISDSHLETVESAEASNTVNEFDPKSVSDFESDRKSDKVEPNSLKDVETQSEVVSDGWLSGISNFFTVSDTDVSQSETVSEVTSTAGVSESVLTNVSKSLSDEIESVNVDTLNEENVNQISSASESEDVGEDEEDGDDDINDHSENDNNEESGDDDDDDANEILLMDGLSKLDTVGEKSYATRHLLSENEKAEEEHELNVESIEELNLNASNIEYVKLNEDSISEAITSGIIDGLDSSTSVNKEKLVSDSFDEVNKFAQTENFLDIEATSTLDSSYTTPVLDLPKYEQTADSSIRSSLLTVNREQESAKPLSEDLPENKLLGYNIDTAKRDEIAIDKITEIADEILEIESDDDNLVNVEPEAESKSEQKLELIPEVDTEVNHNIFTVDDVDLNKIHLESQSGDSIMDMPVENFERNLKLDSVHCDNSDDEFCEAPVIKMETNQLELLESDATDEVISYDMLSQIKVFMENIMYWLPQPVVEASHELENLGISPRVVTLTIIVGFFVFILEISFIAIKKRFKERLYLTKLGSLEQKLFSAVTERESLKQELSVLKLRTEDSSFEYLDAQHTIEDLHQQVQRAKTECGKLQADNATLQEQLETATEVGLELNQMLSEFLTSQSSSTKLQEAVAKLQEQLESQQKNVNSLQLNLDISTQEKNQQMNDIEVLKTEMIALEKMNEELKISQSELFSVRDKLSADSKEKEVQIIELQQSNSQLLRESEEWNESVQQLQLVNNSQQGKIQELTDALSIKTNDLAAIKEYLANLKFSKESGIEDNDSGGAIALNADKILQQITDVSNIKAELKEVKEERDSLKYQLISEGQARISVEESAKACISENEKLKEEYTKAHMERLEAQTKLDVLSNYFKEKEMQLQKELGVQEAMRLQSQDSATSVTQRIATYEQESELNKAQLAALKAEIENQERSFRTKLLAHEKKAHENWLAARVAERKLEQMKQEASILRNRLTLLEQEKSDQNVANKSGFHQAHNSSNGEIMTSQHGLKPDDRSTSMDLPTSGRSSLFREPIESDHKFPFLPLDRPLPPPPFMPPMPILPPPPHMIAMGSHVPLLPPPPPIMLGPRRPPMPPLDHWMPDRVRHSSPYERQSPPVLGHQRSPPPPFPGSSERSMPHRHGASQSPVNSERRGEELYPRDFYREQTPPSRFSEQPSPHNNFVTDNSSPHLRKYKLDNGALDQSRPQSIINRSNNNLSLV